MAPARSLFQEHVLHPVFGCKTTKNTLAARRDRLQNTIDERPISASSRDPCFFFSEHVFEERYPDAWDFHMKNQPNKRTCF